MYFDAAGDNNHRSVRGFDTWTGFTELKHVHESYTRVAIISVIALYATPTLARHPSVAMSSLQPCREEGEKKRKTCVLTPFVPYRLSPPISAIGTVCLAALSALPFVVLDLVLMIAAFAAVRSGDATLLRSTFVLHFLAALTVSWSHVACRGHVRISVVAAA